MPEKAEYDSIIQAMAVLRRHGLDLLPAKDDAGEYLEVRDSSDLEFLEGRDFTWLLRQPGLLDAMHFLKQREDKTLRILRDLQADTLARKA